MLRGVSERQEGEDGLILADSEVVDQDFGGARAIVQDRAMMLHHPTRRPAGTAGVDQAGKVLARHREAARLRFLDMRLAAGDEAVPVVDRDLALLPDAQAFHADDEARSDEHTSELQSLMRISYAVFCLK